jgi:hypothetical protein
MTLSIECKYRKGFEGLHLLSGTVVAWLYVYGVAFAAMLLYSQ